MNSIRRKIAAIIAALSLALSVPGAALAATASQTANEALTVNSQITLTGLPPNINYGSGLGGETKSSPAFTLTATTNNAAGLKVTWAASNLTSGSNVIDASSRRLFVPTFTGCTAADGFNVIPAAPVSYGVAGTDKLVCSRTTAGTATLTDVVASVVLPAAAVPGAYTGTTTFKATEN
jgi:hypothetical protein